jgi:hypothetical protein
MSGTVSSGKKRTETGRAISEPAFKLGYRRLARVRLNLAVFLDPFTGS